MCACAFGFRGLSELGCRNGGLFNAIIFIIYFCSIFNKVNVNPRKFKTDLVSMPQLFILKYLIPYMTK